MSASASASTTPHATTSTFGAGSAPGSGPHTSAGSTHQLRDAETELSLRHEELVLVPTLRPSPRAGPSASGVPRRLGSGHGRSISHPFPSLFGGGKKVDRDLPPANGHRPSESPGPAKVVHGDRESATQAAPSRARPKPLAEADLTPGRCMTCDTLVRWPKDLKIFRCTVCSTINDLKPIGQDPRGPQGPWGFSRVMGGSEAAEGTSKKALPLSIEKTQAIIDRCLVRHLQRRLNKGSPALGGHAESPPVSPRGTVAPTSVPQPLVPLASASQECSTVTSPGSSSLPADMWNPSPRPGDHPSPWIFPERRANSTAGQGSPSLHDGIPPHLEAVRHKKSESALRATSANINRTHLSPSRDANRQVNGVQRPSSNDRRPRSRSGDRERAGSHGSEVDGIIFKPLEQYIITSFNHECVNASFSVTGTRSGPSVRSISDGPQTTMRGSNEEDDISPTARPSPMSDLDAKTLLLGDVAENGSWWTGNRTDGRRPSHSSHGREPSTDGGTGAKEAVSLKTPRIDWIKLTKWYQLVLNAGKNWRARLRDLDDTGCRIGAGHSPVEMGSLGDLRDVEEEIDRARYRLQRTLLKASEGLLKRPGRPLKGPEDIRFLLVLLANPLLYGRGRPPSPDGTTPKQASHGRDRSPSGPGQHSGIIKRILGLLANLPNECHRYLIAWFARFSESHFQRVVDLVGSFVTYRLTRQHGRKKSDAADLTAGLIPNLQDAGRTSSAQLHAALGLTGSPKLGESKADTVVYGEDWQIKAASKVMALLFAANNSGIARKSDGPITEPPMIGSGGRGGAARQRARNHGQMLPTSDFYNSLLDYSDLIADFESWELKRGKFSFCQYPFFLSIWAKIHIMEHDARRQMEIKAREAFFDSIMSRKAVSQYLVLKVRRDCLAEDSLRGVSEVVGTGQEEIKKSLRIEFLGEEGVDAGGLRKEWFLLLVRDIFDPDHGKREILALECPGSLTTGVGLFVYDEDSQYCYFNPHCFETSDQFFLVGVLLGLAIYNSTILDVALPPFTFKKLLAAAPVPNAGTMPFAARPVLGYTIDDLAEFRPGLASGLRRLLEFDGDVEETFCRNFVTDVDRYGEIRQVPLCPDGETRVVTNSNRREFVDLYVRYLLDTAVTRQFEPFKRGFYTVCGGNALSLFRPEEIELLVRGSDEPLDVASLRAVAVYENWGSDPTGEQEAVAIWFWDFLHRADARDQRKILGFITGSDRIPAMGTTSLHIKVACLGDDCDRFPVARTCFNTLGLYRYSSRAKLEEKLWRAVVDSEGFGLK
ncbi:MAG: putative E3 ubiquitin-protein ligase [Thelocarpon superellum]|nr:MAG: putative E3 ubiquitin-protein ligase [Thelocarpon superellum]